MQLYNTRKLSFGLTPHTNADVHPTIYQHHTVRIFQPSPSPRCPWSNNFTALRNWLSPTMSSKRGGSSKSYFPAETWRLASTPRTPALTFRHRLHLLCLRCWAVMCILSLPLSSKGSWRPSAMVWFRPVYEEAICSAVGGDCLWVWTGGMRGGGD